MGRLDGKTAIVTGAGKGIGAGTARMFAAQGCRVLLADVDEAGGEAVAGEIGEAARFQRLDVTREDDWVAAFETAAGELGGCHALVNCAGILARGGIEDTTLADWNRMLDVNLRGTFLGCRHAVRHMKDTGGGSIVNLSSMAGIVGDEAMVAYNASKGAVRLLTKSIALHCAEKNYRIRCNSVHPGVIETPMVIDYIAQQPDPVAEQAAWESVMPVDFLGTAEDVAAMILYLASDESRLVTGAEMVIDGGATAQ